MTARDDAAVFPAELYEAALGARCVAELNQATPRVWADHGMVRDRYLINPGALAYWLHVHFELNIFAVADDAYSVDELSELLTIGEREYLVPHWCYLSTGIEPGDERPRSWSGIPRPESEAT